MTEHIKTSVKIDIIEPFIIFPDYDFYVLPRTQLNIELYRIFSKNHNETYKSSRYPN